MKRLADKKDLFCTPVWYTKLNIPENISYQAKEYCLSLGFQDYGVKNSNIGGWQSSTLLYSSQALISSPIRYYFDQINVILDRCVKELGIDKFIVPTGMWVNKNGNGNYNHSHMHPGSFLSGCFYLTDDNSEILFHRPYDVNYYWMLNGASKGNTPLSSRSAVYKPSKNELLIFPSWIEHEVLPNTNSNDRISVAFNTILKHNKTDFVGEVKL